MRNLASIQKIKSLQPIEGADKIEVARVLGWDVVVKKNEFQPGDLCVYIEIDSVLPSRDEFNFLLKLTAKCSNDNCPNRWQVPYDFKLIGGRVYCPKCDKLSEEIEEIPEVKQEKMRRIRTIRLRGQLSQGIVFPLSILPNNAMCFKKDMVDTDVTEALGIKKYEPPIASGPGGPNRNKRTKGKRPIYVPLTDETRVQILGPVIEKYQGTVGYISEKLDGSSFSASLVGGKYEVCSRNMNLAKPGLPWLRRLLNWYWQLRNRQEMVRHPERVDAWWSVANTLGLKERMQKYCKNHGIRNIVLQAELIGPRVQGNKYALDDYDLYVFQIYNPDTDSYFSFIDFINAVEEMGLKTVPILNDNYILGGDSDTLLQVAKGDSVLNPKIPREGIVFRPLKEVLVTSGIGSKLHRSRLSFKAINNDFLLRYGE